MIDLSAFSLAGKTVMVTGANTGIGQGIALSIGRAGGRVLGVGRSGMDETARLMAGIGAECVAIKADLAPTAAVQAMFAAASENHGPIDGLVNNAGIIKRVDAVDFTEADWDAVMDVNLKTMFFLCQSFGKQAQADGRDGKIVNIASMLSFQGGIRVASYTASKSGVLGITRLLANEWASKNINVNAIAPALALSRGLRLDEIADEFGISRNTVSYTMKNLFRKTETDRQADLISLFIASPVALEDH